jgi:hypothetical protein
MAHQRFSSAIGIGVPIALIVLGCASVRGRSAKILGSPQEGGLAIAEVVLDADYAHDPNMEATLANLQVGDTRLPSRNTVTEALLLKSDSRSTTLFGDAVAGLIVFPNLAHGMYELRSLAHPRILVEHIRGWEVFYARREFEFGRETGNSVSFEALPGNLTYIGRITLHVGYETSIDPDRQVVEFRGRGGDVTVQISREPEDELRAWNGLLTNAAESPWAARIEERIAELRSVSRH